MLRTLIAAAALLFVAPTLADPDAPEPKVLETVVVSGVQPGPGLWRVTNADGHEMWILGTLTPLPKRMTWESRDVEAAIARSKVVLTGPSAAIRIEGGALRGIFLLPSLLGARNNPDKVLLKDVVPADLYARWTALKAIYLPRSRSIEKRRPIFAALKLFEEALDDSGLTLKDLVDPVVRKAAKRHDVPIERSRIELVLEAPGAALKEFKSSRLDDVDCFERTLERLETDLEPMQDRANAWATGDVGTLRATPWSEQVRSCADAVLDSGILKKRGMDDLEQRLGAQWLADAEKTLAAHDVSFAVLPMWQLLHPKGYLAKLVARGYRVEAPDDVPAGDASAAK